MLSGLLHPAHDPDRGEKIGRAEALWRSMMAMFDPANPPEFADPLAWAPFVLAGEGGAQALQLGCAAGGERRPHALRAAGVHPRPRRSEVQVSAVGRSLLSVGQEERALALFAYAAERGALNSSRTIEI